MPLGISDGDEAATREAQAQADACREWCNLTAFQRDILVTLRAFAANGHAPKGLELKEVIGSERGKEINHGRLYPNLDDLNEWGLIDKGEKDARTNEYALTDDGRRVLRAGASRFATVVEGGTDE